jgi:hypothetical protein
LSPILFPPGATFKARPPARRAIERLIVVQLEEILGRSRPGRVAVMVVVGDVVRRKRTPTRRHQEAYAE